MFITKNVRSKIVGYIVGVAVASSLLFSAFSPAFAQVTTSAVPTNTALQSQIQILMQQLIQLQAQLLELLQAKKSGALPVIGTTYSTGVQIDINALDGETHKVDMYEDVAVRVMLSKGYVSTCQVVGTYEDGVENISLAFNKSVDPQTNDFFKEVILAPITQNGILKNVSASCNNGTLTDSSEIVIAASGEVGTLKYLLNGKSAGEAGGKVTEPVALTNCFKSAVNLVKTEKDTFGCVWGGKSIKEITLGDL